MNNLVPMVWYSVLACAFSFFEVTYVNDPSWHKDCLAERIGLSSYLVLMAIVWFCLGCVHAHRMLKERSKRHA